MKIRVLDVTVRTMELNIDVFDVNVRLLFGLYTLDEYKIYINNDEDVLFYTEPSYKRPTTRKFGNLFS